jgi:molybdopterin/thiamine biosynthesis adenylyltransferase
MNRLVTAAMADLDTPKAAAARRLIRAVNPSANVTVIEKPLQTSESLDSLKDVDVIFGCVDNDGARLVLNDFAVAYRIPYFDVATGIEPGKNGIDTIGGRVSIVLPNHPCLNCMHEIDNNEASYFLSSHEDQHNQIQRGYISGIDIPAPSVVSLNAVVSSVAINEFAVLISGIRGINVFTQYDLLGNISGGNIPSQRLSPMLHKKRKGCVTCSHSGSGDTIFIERYSVS